MRCWRSYEIACPSHRRSIHSETSQLRYMLGSHPQVTTLALPSFISFTSYIYICSQRCSEFHFIINLTDADSTNSVFRFLFANGTFEKGCHSSGNHLIVVLVSLFTLVSETFTDETRECGIKVFKRLETRLDTLRHGLNRYFYRERWLLFHRANHQKLAQFIIRTAARPFVTSRQKCSTRFRPFDFPSAIPFRERGRC